MDNKSTEVSILVSSPDSYNEVFKVFMNLFHKYWKDCKYDLILANNVMDYDDDKVNVINCGENAMSWCQRTVQAIKQTKSKYYIVITEDSLITDFIDTNEIEKIIQIMKSNSLVFYKLYPKPNASGKLYLGIPHVHEIPKRQPYGLNLNTAIWERDYLLNCLGDGTLTGWDIEEKWLYEASIAPNESFSNCVVDDRNVLSTVHGVAKGKWLPKSLERLEAIGCKVDTGSRGVLSKKEEFVISARKKFNNISSPKLRKVIKGTLSKVGFKFTTKY